MKRVSIAPEHKKFFQINGYIAFEFLVSPEEMKALFATIEKRRSELPGFDQENLFRSLPEVMEIAQRLGPIGAALLARKPIRIAYDRYAENLEIIPEIEEREVGLLLSASGKGLFFTEPSHLYKEPDACYLFIVLTANFVNNPIVSK